MRVKVRSRPPFCPLFNEGATSLLHEINEKLESLSKLVEGEAKEAKKRHERLQNCIYHLQNKEGV